VAGHESRDISEEVVEMLEKKVGKPGLRRNSGSSPTVESGEWRVEGS
jgi:hypothetical protein